MAGDGAFVGTFFLTVGNGPIGMAYDGANMWVANGGDNTVTKLRASDRKVSSGFRCGIVAGFHCVFDGANIWVTNELADTVTKLRATDGACVGTCTFSAGGAAGSFAIGVAKHGIIFGLGAQSVHQRAPARKKEEC